MLNEVDKLKIFLEQIPSLYDKSKAVNNRDKYKRTPLFYAIYNNSYDMVEYLI